MHKNIAGKVGLSRSSSSLRPPLLFRSLGPPEFSASLPPHRRLRSLFYRSRAVLPTNTLSFEAPDTHTFTDFTLRCNDSLSEDDQVGAVSTELQPEVDPSQHSKAVFSSGCVSQCPQAPSLRRGRQQLSHFCPSVQPSGRSRGRQGTLVSPLQSSEHPAIQEKQQQKRKKKRGYKVDCTGKYLAPSLTEKKDDTKLCEWLQNLGFAESHEVDPGTSPQQPQRLFVPRRAELKDHQERDASASRRRNRRPHFLPPISQSGSHLHVPLLLPKNSPPPSPCSFLDAPIHTMAVPLLHSFSLRRK